MLLLLVDVFDDDDVVVIVVVAAVVFGVIVGFGVDVVVIVVDVVSANYICINANGVLKFAMIYHLPRRKLQSVLQHSHCTR